MADTPDVTTFIDKVVAANAPELVVLNADEFRTKSAAWAALPEVERSYTVAQLAMASLLLTGGMAQALERVEARQEAQGELIAGVVDQLAAMRDELAAARAELGTLRDELTAARAELGTLRTELAAWEPAEEGS